MCANIHLYFLKAIVLALFLRKYGKNNDSLSFFNLFLYVCKENCIQSFNYLYQTMKKNKESYKWTYVSVGGTTRVDIASGEDIAHLGELDKKQWTVLSCPVKGLELDERTLTMMDTNNDGKIHVDEVIAAANWLTDVLKDNDMLLKQEDTLPLDAFNIESEEGKRLAASARHILDNLGKEDATSISVADTSDSVAIFAKTQFNGDGIITPGSTDDESLQAVVNLIIATIGKATDRSGVDGVNAEQIEQFYAALADYSQWQAEGQAAKDDVFPYGDDTAAALDACNAIKEKMDDFYMRCKLTAFAADKAESLDVTAGQMEAVSNLNLAVINDDIAQCPLARVTAEAVLPYNGINPAWQGAFDALRTLVLDKENPDADSVSEAQWKTALARFDAYNAWCAAHKGDEVASLGIETVDALLKADRKGALLELVEKDNEQTEEANAIDAVDMFMHLYRDFYTLLKNYVSMTDFYNSYKDDVKAVFQAGRLYIDQRSTDLCILVSDMGKHGEMASLSGMYIVYCACVSKMKPEPITIAAVLTDGDVDNLRVGTNAVFYDRDGLDWDATVTKIVDNPISVRQAFWAPYKKLANWISDRINKSAAEKESASTANMLNKADNVKVPTTAEGAAAAPTPDAKKTSFDIAKFAGIFAAIGMAVGYIASALVSLAHGITAKWYNIFLILLVLILIISGPSMFIAWRKLRRRNLAPVLNANGWAINSKIRVNTRFGATLTHLVKFPKAVSKDPFETPAWIKWLRRILLLLVVAFAVLFFTNKLAPYGLAFRKAKPAVEAVEQSEAPAEENAPVADVPAAPAEEASVPTE